MSLNDLMSDFVARINNARLAGLPQTTVLKNKLTLATCKKLKTLGYFNGFSESQDGREITVDLNLDRVHFIKRVSTPGQRVYASAIKFPKIIGGVGFNIVTTSQGVMTHIEAVKAKTGGEVLFQIY